MRKFFAHFLESLPENAVVADLGAGSGILAMKILDAGAKRVIAVERRPQEQSVTRGIEWVAGDVTAWANDLGDSASFDGLLMKNLLQFLPKEQTLTDLLPRLATHVNPGGIIAIETFTKAPSPPFPKPNTAYYSLAELQPLFKDWETVRAEEAMDESGKDMNGRGRTFYLTRLIVRKP